jgi:DNA-binding beta-propeller fold protein YncE
MRPAEQRGNPYISLATALDSNRGVLYVTNSTSSELSEVSTARCNAIRTSGCGAAPRVLPVSSEPQSVIVDQHSNTVYLTNTYQTGSITVLAGRP